MGSSVDGLAGITLTVHSIPRRPPPREPHRSRSPTEPALAFPEHPPENRIHVLEVIAEVELLLDLVVAQIFLHLGVLLQQRLEIAFAAPHRHRVALGEPY